MDMILDRALYKKIKGMNKEQLNRFIQDIYKQGKDDAGAASVDYDMLKKDLSKIKSVGKNRLNEIMAVIDKHINLCEDNE